METCDGAGLYLRISFVRMQLALILILNQKFGTCGAASLQIDCTSEFCLWRSNASEAMRLECSLRTSCIVLPSSLDHVQPKSRLCQIWLNSELIRNEFLRASSCFVDSIAFWKCLSKMPQSPTMCTQVDESSKPATMLGRSSTGHIASVAFFLCP